MLDTGEGIAWVGVIVCVNCKISRKCKMSPKNQPNIWMLKGLISCLNMWWWGVGRSLAEGGIDKTPKNARIPDNISLILSLSMTACPDSLLL